MALPWVRVDSNIASHDKILELLGRRNGRAIAFSYVCAIAYAGGNGTDGHIPFAALTFIHASKHDAEVLVEVGLFEPNPRGWTIRNFGNRQQLSAIGDLATEAKRRASAKANCVRWHGAECGCWEKATS